MSSTYNPGRVAGFWYLLLILIGPLRLIYVQVAFPAAVPGRLAHHRRLCLCDPQLYGRTVPQYQDKVFTIPQPAFFGELAIMLWLVIKVPSRQRWTPQPYRRQLVRLHYCRLTTPALGVV
jgi:hypothetical protein